MAVEMKQVAQQEAERARFLVEKVSFLLVQFLFFFSPLKLLLIADLSKINLLNVDSHSISVTEVNQGYLAIMVRLKTKI